MDETSELFTTIKWPWDEPIVNVKNGKMFTR